MQIVQHLCMVICKADCGIYLIGCYGLQEIDITCRDELRAAWAVYTPLLHAIDAGKVELLSYPYGTRGPPQSDVLVSKNGFVKNAEYKWEPMPNRKSFDMQRPPPGRL